jgi:bifunctional ADP-heptose synthase (sugar kinase/adenylyltransferase)
VVEVREVLDVSGAGDKIIAVAKARDLKKAVQVWYSLTQLKSGV